VSNRKKKCGCFGVTENFCASTEGYCSQYVYCSCRVKINVLGLFGCFSPNRDRLALNPQVGLERSSVVHVILKLWLQFWDTFGAILRYLTRKLASTCVPYFISLFSSLFSFLSFLFHLLILVSSSDNVQDLIRALDPKPLRKRLWRQKSMTMLSPMNSV
jgi:hypothetical protein